MHTHMDDTHTRNQMNAHVYMANRREGNGMMGVVKVKEISSSTNYPLFK